MRDLNIAYGNSCMAKKWSNKTITFGELCGRLENTIRTTETVEEYQKMKRAEREAAKDKGGFVGGQLKGGRRKRENVVSRSMLTMDVDKGEKGFIESYEMLASYTSVLYTTHGHTPEAPRFRIIIPLTRDVTPDEYQAIARYFADSHRFIMGSRLLSMLLINTSFNHRIRYSPNGKVHRPRFPNFTGCHRQIGSFNLPLLHGTVKNCRAEHIFGNN